MADKNISALPNIPTLSDDALLVAEQQGEAGNINFGQVRKFAESAAASVQKGDPGEPGKDFRILGYYDTLALLRAAQTSPEAGDAYGVGTAAPYTVYVWDGVNLDWVDNGTIQGPSGEKGDTGTVFTPHMDSEGNLSWTNDGGLENPETVNLKGPQGDAFKYEDFTEEQLENLTGPQGEPFTYEDFTEEQLANLKGEKGNPFTYDDFTEEQLAALKGEKGDAFTYEDFTEEQLAALVGPKGDPGNSIQSITRTAGNGASGTTDTYTVTLTDGSTTEFYVYNGKDGEGAGDMTADVYDPQGKKTDVFAYVDNAVKDVSVTTDATPTEGSTNPVQSGGVYDALEEKQDKDFIVTATFGANSTVTEISATYDEIISAINAGKNVVVQATEPTGRIFTLRYNAVYDAHVVFTGNLYGSGRLFALYVSEEENFWSEFEGASTNYALNLASQKQNHPIPITVTDNGDGTYSVDYTNAVMHEMMQVGENPVVDYFGVKMYAVESNETAIRFSATKDGTLYSFVVENEVGTFAITEVQPKITGTAGQFVGFDTEGNPAATNVTADDVTFSDNETFQDKYDNGELTGKPGDPGVGIESIEQTTTSTEDGGENVFTVTLTNGSTATFTVKNGSKGSTGASGSNGSDGKDATINGVNALTLEAESPIKATQDGNKLTLGLDGDLGSSATTVSATLTTSGWSSHSVLGYQQTVTVTGITAAAAAIDTDCELSTTDKDSNTAILEAFALIAANPATPGTNQVTYYAESVPSVNVPVYVRWM